MERPLLKKRIKRPPFEGLYPYLVFLLIGFAAADLVMISVRGRMLPTQVPPSRPRRAQQDQIVPRERFAPIISRNIFSRDGTIPETLAEKKRKEDAQQSGESAPDVPVPSNLPLTLVGTIVHSNPEKSIANVEVKPKSTVMAVRVGKNIDTLATLLAVERGKIFIRNLSNQRKEFIEIKNLTKVSFSAAKPATGAPPAGKQEVRQTSQGKFEINRADVLKYTSDMSSVLQQAAMQPRRKANGEIDCFRFLSIQPNSIYTQLGFQTGDCIKAVNGEPVDSPAKAMELYNALKGSNNIKITVERDGRDMENDYTVK